jgi:DNA polymerase-3 subunit gamma/tau
MEDLRIKYRPKTLEEVWGNDHVKMTWDGYLRKGYFPRSIILSSNFGMGKTTLAQIFAKDIIKCDSEPIFCEDFMKFNSPKCDFATVNKMIQNFTYYIMKPRVLFFDEAHRMPDKAQDGFLTVIDDIDFLTFIFATTDLDKIDGGLQQRSDIFKLKPPSKEILMKELGKISVLENIRIVNDALDFLIEFSGFCPRACLGNLQTLSHNEGVINLEIARQLLLQ